MLARFLDLSLGAPTAEPPVPVRRTLYIKRFRSISQLILKSYFSRIDFGGSTDLPEGASVIYGNHPSYWDPLVYALASSHLLPNHHLFAPIDEKALIKHWYFRGLGFFPIRPGSPSGLRCFLKVGRAILKNVERPCLVVTAEGQLTDPTIRPIRLKRGLSRLPAQGVGRKISFVPISLNYRLSDFRPTAWVQVGEPLIFRSDARMVESELHHQLESRLQEAMNKNLCRIKEQTLGVNLLRSPRPNR